MTLVSLSEVVFDESIYPRSIVDAATVDKYAEAMSVGDVFPAIVVESDSNRLLDGKHRLDAHRQLGLAEIEVVFVDVPEGMHPRLFCASLSSRHGLPLPDVDAADLARALYEADPDLSVTAVAKALGRARKTVDGWLVEQRETRRQIEERQREVRRYLARLLAESGWTQSQIAEHLGVTRQAIAQATADSPLLDIDEGILREAVDAAPVDVSAVAEGWREDRMFSTWSDEERLLLKRLRAGETVVVNMRDDGDPNLWRWANQAGVAARIDRKSEWGNPFLLPADGDRDTVCDLFEKVYWPHKPSLHAKIDTLSGKALGCWCAPQRCHGDFLEAQVAESLGLDVS